jgi:hypothetical protein
MGLQASGPIKISEIPPVFGGSAPHNLDEYYRGGSNVAASNVNASIPTSGTIKLTDFYSTGGNSINVISQRQIGGTDRLFYNNETIPTNANKDSQTKLVIVYCSRSTSDTGGEISNKTEFGPCTVTGKTVTEVLREGESFEPSSISGPSGDVLTSASVQYICNLGNESSFNITLGRSNASGQFAGTGPALAMIIQVDGVSFTSPFRSLETGITVKDFSQTLNPVANKGFTVFSTAVHPFVSNNVGTPKANGSAMDTTLINSNTTANRCAIAVQNETTGGSVAYTLDGSGTTNNGLASTTIGNYAF